ncbi:hypothetical protein V2S66_27685 [Streptomyces sp. V4-01]|uniref:Uncharacterized protein n=1 Tax=Actinacidiphila polyblastidii TaxID=3110430 RepID=A0ABU7PIU3_9ACTN|nr:hypothetical protein [Streptomyces sp. V4-01]
MSDDSPVPGPVPEPDPAAAPEPAPEPESEAAPEPAATPWPAPPPPSYEPRRRGRTTLLIAAAAVLGVLAGGGLGYRIQDQRAPTPLPPLAGAPPAQPKGAGTAAAALPAAQDRDAVFQGDLLTLLMPTPKGGKQKDRGWVSLIDFAEQYERPAAAFTDFARNDFRRAADVAWLAGAHTRYHVTLAQFRDEAAPHTPEELLDQGTYADENSKLGDSVQIPATMDGKVWPSAAPYRDPGYEPDYFSLGVARVGDIYVEVTVDSTRPVTSSVVMAVIKTQLERL